MPITPEQENIEGKFIIERISKSGKVLERQEAVNKIIDSPFVESSIVFEKPMTVYNNEIISIRPKGKSMTVKLKKKSGDGLPLDATGQMIYLGSVVACSIITEGNKLEEQGGFYAAQKLGVVKKLFKNGKAIVVLHHATETLENVTVKANESLIVLDIEKLNPKVPLFEALKMFGKKTEFDDLNK